LKISIGITGGLATAALLGLMVLAVLGPGKGHAEPARA
jgi:hypothetical protein